MINGTKNFIGKNKYPLLLVALILACLWPLSFFLFIPKWDNINGYLPYRYFISDYIWNGHLPLWNPFQRLGIPGYSDLQSGCWNPITWIIMLFGKYTIGSLIVELLSYYIIAGLGMYKLGIYFYNNPKTSFIIGLCYALSGFMVGSSQLMVFIVGVAWLPWCIYGLLKYLKTFETRYAIFTAIVTAICTSAVSPAYTIVLGYIYVCIFLWHFWIHRKQREGIKKVIKGGLIILFGTILLLLPYLNSFIEFAPYFNRITKLPYDGFLLSNPFTVKEYISFIFPYTIISDTAIFNHTDLSLRNGYFSIVGVLFFCISFFTVKNKRQLLLICLLIISLVLAAGSETFIYKIVYNLPGFGVFRHPSFFRTYSIFCGLLLSGFALNKVLLNGKLDKKEVNLLFGFFGIVCAIAILSFFKTSLSEVIENIKGIIHLQEFSSTSFYTHLFINSSLLIFLVLLVLLIKKFLKTSLFVSLAILTFLDLGIQTKLTAPTTLHHSFTYNIIAQYFDELPNQINQKDNDKPLKYLDETQGLKSVDGLWKNLSTFNKTLSFKGENPMRFKSFDDGKESGALERNIENELLFFPIKEYFKGDTLQKGLIWGVESPIEIVDGKTTIDSIHVGYNEFTAQVNNSKEKDQWLILNQNYHHLWRAKYNDKPMPVHKVNEMIMGLKIPAKSTGEVQFVFDSSKTIYLFLISLLGYLIFSIYLIKDICLRNMGVNKK